MYIIIILYMCISASKSIVYNNYNNNIISVKYFLKDMMCSIT